MTTDLGRTATTKEAFIDDVKDFARKMKDGQYIQVYGVYDRIEKAYDVQKKYRSAIEAYVSNNSLGFFRLQGDGATYGDEGYFLFRLTKTGTRRQKFEMPKPEVFNWLQMIGEYERQETDGQTALPLHGTIPDVDAFETIFDAERQGELSYWNLESEEEIGRPTRADHAAAGVYMI